MQTFLSNSDDVCSRSSEQYGQHFRVYRHQMTLKFIVVLVMVSWSFDLIHHYKQPVWKLMEVSEYILRVRRVLLCQQL